MTISYTHDSFRIDDNETISYDRLRASWELGMLQLRVIKTFFPKCGATALPKGLFWGASQLPTECGQRVTCSLHKAKFLGWYLGLPFSPSVFASRFSRSGFLSLHSLQGVESLPMCSRLLS